MGRLIDQGNRTESTLADDVTQHGCYVLKS